VSLVFSQSNYYLFIYILRNALVLMLNRGREWICNVIEEKTKKKGSKLMAALKPLTTYLPLMT
jgi:hypothetical protein